jgi:hypothetical protein
MDAVLSLKAVDQFAVMDDARPARLSQALLPADAR